MRGNKPVKKFNKPTKAYVFDLSVTDKINNKNIEAIWTNDLPPLIINTNKVQRSIEVTCLLLEDFDKLFYKYMSNAINAKNH